MSKIRRRGAAMLTNRCLTHMYVIYEVSYAWLQLRQLAYKLRLWTAASAKHTCSLFCSSSFTLASGGLYSHEVGGGAVTWVGAWQEWAWAEEMYPYGHFPPQYCTDSSGFQRGPSARGGEAWKAASLNRSSSHSPLHC